VYIYFVAAATACQLNFSTPPWETAATASTISTAVRSAHVDFDQFGKFAAQVIHMHTRAPINGRWVFVGEEKGFHWFDPSTSSGHYQYWNQMAELMAANIKSRCDFRPESRRFSTSSPPIANLVVFAIHIGGFALSRK
jgi:hypothetical protein